MGISQERQEPLEERECFDAGIEDKLEGYYVALGEHIFFFKSKPNLRIRFLFWILGMSWHSN